MLSCARTHSHNMLPASRLMRPNFGLTFAINPGTCFGSGLLLLFILSLLLLSRYVSRCLPFAPFVNLAQALGLLLLGVHLAALSLESSFGGCYLCLLVLSVRARILKDGATKLARRRRSSRLEIKLIEIQPPIRQHRLQMQHNIDTDPSHSTRPNSTISLDRQSKYPASRSTACLASCIDKRSYSSKNISD